MTGGLVAAVLVILAGSGLAALALVRRRLVLVTVQGPSMLPTYRHGERVLVRRGHRCRPGDVAVFRTPPGLAHGQRWLVKRVAGVGGEPVPAWLGPQAAGGLIPDGFLLVRGDGELSLDSRQFGGIPAASVLGVVIRPVRPAPG